MTMKQPPHADPASQSSPNSRNTENSGGSGGDVIGQFPLHLVLLFMFGLMLAGPVVFFAFLLGGSTAGFVALAVFAVVFVSIYIKGGTSGAAHKDK